MSQKTGSMGQPWVVLEQNRPPKVADHYRYWGDPPPEVSERCKYWLRQIDRGWLPNRKILMHCYDCSSEWYGVYIWEYINLIAPQVHTRMTAVEASRGAGSVGVAR